MVALTGLLLTMLGWAVPAHGHASPVTTDPADGQVLVDPPRTLTVSFTEQVQLARRGNQVLDASGEVVPADFSVRDDVLTIRPEAKLGTGTHIVTWRVVSADSHPVSGGFTFSVGAPSATEVEIPVDETRRELTFVRSLAEAARYAGVLGLAGVVLFTGFVAPPIARRHHRTETRLRRTAVVFAVLAVGGSILLMPITAIWEAGESVAALGAAWAWGDGLASSAGVAAVLVLIGAAACLVGLVRPASVAAAAGSAVVLSSLVVVGHTRSYGPSWLVLTADLVHVLAAATWWGGLIGLVVLLGAGRDVRAKTRALAVSRFSTAAAVSVGALVVAGIALYWRIAGSLSGLWESDYGRLVLVKSLLVLPAVGIAAWNRRTLVPRVVGQSDVRAESTLRRAVAFEAALVALVIACTSVLVTLSPPTREPEVSWSEPVEQGATIEVEGDARVSIVVVPARRGTNAIQVSVLEADGEPVDPIGAPVLRISLEEADIGPFERPLTPTAPGHWEASADLPLAGEWTMEVSVRLSEFTNPVVGTEVTVR